MPCHHHHHHHSSSHSLVKVLDIITARSWWLLELVVLRRQVDEVAARRLLLGVLAVAQTDGVLGLVNNRGIGAVRFGVVLLAAELVCGRLSRGLGVIGLSATGKSCVSSN